jgi:hypothetical protein
MTREESLDVKNRELRLSNLAEYVSYRKPGYQASNLHFNRALRALRNMCIHWLNCPTWFDRKEYAELRVMKS